MIGSVCMTLNCFENFEVLTIEIEPDTLALADGSFAVIVKSLDLI